MSNIITKIICKILISIIALEIWLVGLVIYVFVFYRVGFPSENDEYAFQHRPGSLSAQSQQI
jgi:hypothetical protein